MSNNITYEHKDLYDLLTDKTTPKVPDYEHLAFPIPPEVEMGLVGISKKDPARLKELETQDLSEARTCKRNTVLDCKALAQKLLEVKPELKEWLEANYGEYL